MPQAGSDGGSNLLRLCVSTALAGFVLSAAAGNRPYELVEAGRTKPAQAELIDFETPGEWIVSCTNAEATFSRSQEEQIFGDWTGKLVYRATGPKPAVRFRPEKPLPMPKEGFDTFNLWIRGSVFTQGANRIPGEPTPTLCVLFRMADGTEKRWKVTDITWKNWFLAQIRFPAFAIEPLKSATFAGFELSGGIPPSDRILYFDAFSLFHEAFPPLALKPRPKRNLTPLPGADQGLNTGEGRLPFPTRDETILPDVAEPEPGEPLARFTGGAVAGADTNALTVTTRRVGRTLIVDFEAPPGAVTEIAAGLPSEGRFVKSVDVPFLNYNGGGGRVTVDMVEGKQTFFRLALFDWYRSNASDIRVKNTPKGCNLSVIYNKKSDGTYNPVSERLFITLSPDFAGVLPNIPNPKSPWKQVTGNVTWRSHASYDHEDDKALWRAVHRHGIREVLITDHETMWREGGESFTLRTQTDPSKGGDEAHNAYTRFLIDELGYRYGPYNNFTDFAPANAYWTPDWVARTPALSMPGAWMRCYAFRPAAAPEACETVAPIIQEKFSFNTAYCDVHTAVPFWGNRTDYDARVPGAGTFAETFYAWGETLLLQKKIWNGPVWSEGGHHFFFAGLSDGNYGQDRGRPYGRFPWLVDFDVLKIHPLETDFGMGCLSMFMPNSSGQNGYVPDAPTPQALTNVIDRFIGATLAFGHSGYLILDYLFDPPRPFGLAYCGPGERVLSENGFAIAMKSHFMVQQIASRYTQANAVAIAYADASGSWLPTGEAIKADAVKRCQLRVTYDDGTVVCVNGNEKERLKAEGYDLPPCGYCARSGDGAITVTSGDGGGVRADYCDSPAYIFIDGRNGEAVRERARATGTALCRTTPDGWEIIPLGNRPCAFRIPGGEATALTFDGKTLRPAETVFEDGWFAVKPVAGAFSYSVKRRGG